MQRTTDRLQHTYGLCFSFCNTVFSSNSRGFPEKSRKGISALAIAGVVEANKECGEVIQVRGRSDDSEGSIWRGLTMLFPVSPIREMGRCGGSQTEEGSGQFCGS